MSAAVVQCVGGPYDGLLVSAPPGAVFGEGAMIVPGDCDDEMGYMVNADSGTATYTRRPRPEGAAT